MKFLLALDVDGTLEDSRTALHSDWGALIARFEEMGGITTLISGRLPSGMTRVASALGIPPGRKIAGADGAVFSQLDPFGSDTPVSWNSLSYGNLAPLVNEYPGLVLTPTRVIMAGPVSPHMVHLAQISSPRVDTCDSFEAAQDLIGGEPVVGYRFLLPRQQGATLSAVLHNREDTIIEIFDDAAFSAEFVGIALRPPASEKGDALICLAKEYGIPQGGTIAMGDWVTDISLFQKAAWSFCPREALPVVRQSARRVSSHGMKEHWAYLEFQQFLDTLVI